MQFIKNFQVNFKTKKLSFPIGSKKVLKISYSFQKQKFGGSVVTVAMETPPHLNLLVTTHIGVQQPISTIPPPEY